MGTQRQRNSVALTIANVFAYGAMEEFSFLPRQPNQTKARMMMPSEKKVGRPTSLWPSEVITIPAPDHPPGCRAILKLGQCPSISRTDMQDSHSPSPTGSFSGGAEHRFWTHLETEGACSPGGCDVGEVIVSFKGTPLLMVCTRF